MPSLWVPVIVLGGLIVLADYLVHDWRHLDAGFFGYAAQGLIFGLLVAQLYSALRLVQNRHQLRLQTEAILASQQQLDTARNRFITEIASDLEGDVMAVETLMPQLPSKSEATDSITEGVNRIREVINRFGLLAAIGAVASPATSDVGQLLQQASTTLQPQITAKHLTLNLPAGATTISGDPKFIGQVLTSVLDNAVKFSPEGGTVGVAITQSSDWVNATITDGGPGIPAEKLPRLFQPFTRAEGTAMQFDKEGLGFSLYLDKIILDHLGGAITVSPGSGHGTTVQIRLPKNGPVAPQRAGAPKTASQPI